MMIHDPFEGNVPVYMPIIYLSTIFMMKVRILVTQFFYFHDRTVIEELSIHLAI
jgi:hypothetical protein